MYICKNVIFCFSISKSLLFIFFEAHPEMHLAKTTRPMILRIFILASLLWTNITKFVFQLLMRNISSSYCTHLIITPTLWLTTEFPTPALKSLLSSLTLSPGLAVEGEGTAGTPEKVAWPHLPPPTLTPTYSLHALHSWHCTHSYGLDLGRNGVFFC